MLSQIGVRGCSLMPTVGRGALARPLIPIGISMYHVLDQGGVLPLFNYQLLLFTNKLPFLLIILYMQST